jgi:uncharacterized iron-regulated membrane protein
MTFLKRIRFREIWLQIHLWLGLVFALLLIPVGLSGSALVWHDTFEEWLEPQRYATSGSERRPALSQIIKTASESFGPSVLVSSVRFPQDEGSPVVVTARADEAEGGARPRSFAAWIDPPTGKILDSAETTSAFFGVLHRLHGNLLVPEWSGRQIVGWAGVALLISTISGLYLWWPRGAFARALSWGRTSQTTSNIHHSFGFWIAIPLAIVTLTGIYISFPNTARAIVEPSAQQNASQQRPRSGPTKPLVSPALSADEALALALGKAGETDPISLSLPTETNTSWRAQMRVRETREIFTVSVDDQSRAVKTPGPGGASAGDATARLMRQIHDGNEMGFVWQLLVFLTGLMPATMATTGLVMWLRKRSRRSALGASVHSPAE